MKVYLIAGEPSGDLLGSRLMRAMVAKNPEIKFYGIGGETMQQEGLNSLFDISELAIMGLFEVLPSLPKILKSISTEQYTMKSTPSPQFSSETLNSPQNQ